LSLEVPPDMSTPQWLTRVLPDRTGMGAYLEMIRDVKNDPDRRPRPKRGEAKDVAPHLTLNRTHVEDWIDPIYELLTDGRPRTLNAIGVELIDKTADITAGTPLGECLWLLVERGDLAYTASAPVLFTLPELLDPPPLETAPT